MDLKTNYLGLELRSPLIPSAGPFSERLGNLRKMEDAGAGAVVLHSLFMEQLEREARTLDHYLDRGTESFAESLTYFPAPQEYRLGPDEYMEHVRQAKKAVGIPIIASLNGTEPGTWVKAAAQIEQAGADGLELNLYDIPADLETSGPQVEDRYLEVVREVRAVVKLPLAVKVSPYFSAPGQMMKRLVEAGADALVLFNRFYQPDIDLEHLEVRPNILLSTPQALRVPLRWIAILYGRIPASLAATGGIHTGEDALKAFMVGADAAMFCSALLLHGISHLDKVRSDIVRWMEEHEYESIAQMKGSISQKSCADPSAFERAQYMKALTGYHLPA